MTENYLQLRLRGDEQMTERPSWTTQRQPWVHAGAVWAGSLAWRCGGSAFAGQCWHTLTLGTPGLCDGGTLAGSPCSVVPESPWDRLLPGDAGEVRGEDVLSQTRSQSGVKPEGG